MFALSPKLSYPKTSNLCTRVHFSSKITSVFENFEWFSFWLPRPEYPPPGRNIWGGGLSGLLWPDNPAGVAAEYKRGGVGLPSGQFQPQPRVSPATAAASPPPPPELWPSPWPVLAGGCSPPPWEGFHQAVFAMDVGIFLTLGCDFTYACSWCLALYLLISCYHESCCMIFFSQSINLCAATSLRKNFEGTGLSAPLAG
jgi:hypothetical protein